MTKRFAIFVTALAVLWGCTGMGKESESLSENEAERHAFTATYNTMEEAETKLMEVLKTRYGCEEESPTTSRYRCYDELVDFILKEPRTIGYAFERLQRECHVDVVTSQDGNLRLYSWNNETGGTWISWSNVCQYRCDNKVYAYEGSILDVKYGTEPTPEEGANNCAVEAITTIYDIDSTAIYLVHSYIRASSNLGYESVEAIKIENGKLVAAPIFSGEIPYYDMDESEMVVRQSHRGVEYSIADWYFKANHGEGWEWTFRYDDKSNILYVPQADPSLTDRYSLYRYDGRELRYVGTDGGFWLHPSIRSYEYLETLFETRDYRIRVDRMYDCTYRYTSWKRGKTMESKPDAIIYNGVYDEDQGTFCFKENGYEYIVMANTAITIRHKGTEIMSQAVDAPIE